MINLETNLKKFLIRKSEIEKLLTSANVAAGNLSLCQKSYPKFYT